MATAALLGTLVPTGTEDDVRNNNSLFTITLTGDTWVALGAAFDAIRGDIIDGFFSAAAEAFGWNATVRATVPDTAVFRLTGTLASITVLATPAYDITADETITVTVPASALTGAAPIVASPTFTITPVAGPSPDPGVGGGGFLFGGFMNASGASPVAPLTGVRGFLFGGFLNMGGASPVGAARAAKEWIIRARRRGRR